MRKGRAGGTGTRKGMTAPQARVVADLLRRFEWFHHGDCVGADKEMHDIATSLGLKTAAHPPLDEKLRAFCKADVVFRPKEYIDRNHDVVLMTEELIAASGSMAEELRGSGTWATIRYARKLRRLVTIVFPDGSVEFSP